MSKTLSTRSLQYSTQIRAPYLTNPFGRHFSYYNKHIKSQIAPVHHKLDGPLIPIRSLRSYSPISGYTSLENTPRLSLTNRSGSSSILPRSNLSISSILLEKKTIHMRNRSDQFK